MKPSVLKKALILLCLCTLLSACGRDKTAQLSYLESDAVILAFGDSLTHGSGAKSHEAYPAVLQDLIARKVVTEATPGDKTTDGLSKLPAALDEHEPDLLLLCLGGNDFLRKKTEADTRANLIEMIEMAKDRRIDIVLLAVPKPALLGMKPHPMYQELASQYGLALENSIITETLSDRDTKSDTIHPNAAGYRMIAEAVAELLRKAGAVR